MEFTSIFISIYPTFSGFVIAVLAAIVTFKDPAKMKYKGWLIATFIFLGLSGIIVNIIQIRLSDAKDFQNKQTASVEKIKEQGKYARLSDKLDVIHADISKSDTSNSYTKRALLVINSVRQDVDKLSNPPEVNLKHKLKATALRLQDQINDYLMNRKKIRPVFVRQQPFSQIYWDEMNKKQQEFDRETMDLYYKNFISKVIEIHDELSNIGLTDIALEDNYKNPVNTIGVRYAAMSMGALALKIQ